METLEALVTEYVHGLVERGAITSEPVDRAFRAVHRHRFLRSWYRPEVDSDLRVTFHLVEYDRNHPTPERLAEIYSDEAIVTAMDGLLPTSSTSQPLLVARMLEHLELRPGMNVLEIGTGTGYNAALLAEIVGSGGSVCTVELQEDVAKSAESHLQGEGYGNVHVFCRDGYLGVPEAAPFDRIEATVGCTDLSPHWLDQLAPGGFILLPLHHGLQDPLVRIERDPNNSERAFGRIVGYSSFMPIQGTLSSANPWRSYGIRHLPEQPMWSRPLPDPLASEGESMGHPLDRPVHRAFHFFLALSSRELWFNSRGYGLADPGSVSVVVMTHEAVAGYSATAHAPSLDLLYERFLLLVERWDQCGRPSPEAYSVEFAPLKLFRDVDREPGMEWIIERPYFYEIVRLPEDGHTTRRNG